MSLLLVLNFSKPRMKYRLYACQRATFITVTYALKFDFFPQRRMRVLWGLENG